MTGPEITFGVATVIVVGTLAYVVNRLVGIVDRQVAKVRRLEADVLSLRRRMHSHGPRFGTASTDLRLSTSSYAFVSTHPSGVAFRDDEDEEGGDIDAET